MAHWIIPSNPNKYKMIKAFAELGMLDQQTKNLIKKGDTVFIYQSSPVSKIVLETIVINDNVPAQDLFYDGNYFVDEKSKKEIEQKGKKSKHIRLQLVTYFDDSINNKLVFEQLVKNGYKGKMQGTIRLEKNPQLFDYIKRVINNLDML